MRRGPRQYVFKPEKDSLEAKQSSRVKPEPKVNEKAVDEVRNLFRTGKNFREISEQTGVSVSYAWRLCHDKTARKRTGGL